jgi:hypothetical protein
MAKPIKTNKVVDELNRNPDKKHWEAFRKYLVKSNARYYKAFFPKKIKRKNDLLAAYVTVYDAKYLPMFRIPIMMKKGSIVEGASIYFKSLINTNKDYKEWVA